MTSNSTRIWKSKAALGLMLSLGSIVMAAPAWAGRISNPVAVFAGLDKITGRITTFDVYMNETVQFGALQVTPKVCYSRDATEAQKVDGFVEVEEITLDRKIRRIFTGWMFADSPGLNAVEHPIYDVWLTGCKVKSDVPRPADLKLPDPTPQPDPAAPKPSADAASQPNGQTTPPDTSVIGTNGKAGDTGQQLPGDGMAPDGTVVQDPNNPPPVTDGTQPLNGAPADAGNPAGQVNPPGVEPDGAPAQPDIAPAQQNPVPVQPNAVPVKPLPKIKGVVPKSPGLF